MKLLKYVAWIIVFSVIWLLVADLYLIGDPTPTKLNLFAPQIQSFKNTGQLLEEGGKIVQSGYVKRHRFEYNIDTLSDLSHHKEIEQYIILQENYCLLILVRNLYYFTDIWIIERIQSISSTDHQLVYSSQSLSTSPLDGTSGVVMDKFTFNSTSYDMYREKVAVRSPKFNIDILLTNHDSQDTMAYMQKFNEDGSQFEFSHKFYGYEVVGSSTNSAKRTMRNFGQETQAFKRWTRGVWPYSTYWVWASGIGNNNNVEFAINLGHGMQLEDSQHSEDCIFIDSEMIKLATMKANFDDQDLTNPWNFQSELLYATDKAAIGEITFVPTGIETQDIDYLLIRSQLDIIFGSFSGRIITTDKGVITFADIKGIIERHRARW